MALRPAPEVDPILLAAAELFEKRGYDDVSVEMIADRAGVGRSTAFARYLSKQGILIGLVDAFLYQFAFYLTQFDLTIEAPLQTPVGPPGRRRSGRAPSTPPPTITPPDRSLRNAPAQVRLLRALHEFGSQWGPLARVALTAKDLPWVAREISAGRAVFRNALRLYLGPVAGEKLNSLLAADLLKYACCSECAGESERLDPAAIGNLFQLATTEPPKFGAPRPATPPPPVAPGTDPLRQTPFSG
ncbi:MAG: helix-turn-helix transcriptional regulator [Deltaproteobacteria bacterium]|nr:helix-turn-helix transcriptional regulator [Deltaproteobacteria bacterium]